MFTDYEIADGENVRYEIVPNDSASKEELSVPPLKLRKLKNFKLNY